jgi:hypothetical protein
MRATCQIITTTPASAESEPTPSSGSALASVTMPPNISTRPSPITMAPNSCSAVCTIASRTPVACSHSWYTTA